MQRRSFLKGAGIVTIAVAAGGVWRAFDQGVFSTGQGPAYEPWKNWRSATNDSPLALVRAAILAASPHNTQPWLFKVTDSSIDLYIDPQRNVGALDPYLREEHIGIGCALENLLLAAPANGYAATVTLEPGKLEPITNLADAKPHLLAHVELSSAQREETELYNAIPHRHTNRAPYDRNKPLPPDFLAALANLPGDDTNTKIFLFTAEADRRKIAAISSAANTGVYSDPNVKRASENWIRSKWSDVQQHRDGLTIDAFGLPPIAGAAAKMLTPRMLQWAASHGQQNGYTDLMLSAPLMGFIAVRDRYDRQQCLRAGRIWQRAHLFSTAHQIAARPCNEALEMIDHERANNQPPKREALLTEITGDPTWQPTFVFYMGYPTLQPHASPRRPAESVLV
jgi:nitroreductase